MTAPALPYEAEQAIHTALAEIPDAHLDDQLDCVYGQIGSLLYDEWEHEIAARLEALS